MFLVGLGRGEVLIISLVRWLGGAIIGLGRWFGWWGGFALLALVGWVGLLWLVQELSGEGGGEFLEFVVVCGFSI